MNYCEICLWQTHTKRVCEVCAGLIVEAEKKTKYHLAKESAAYRMETREIEQILGKALGYPWYKDDLKSFPDATEADGVCVGEHTTVTLAMEAAKTIQRLKDDLRDCQTMKALYAQNNSRRKR